jgi:hypothetical protein
MDILKSLLLILGLTNLERTLLGEKGTKSPVYLRWTSTRFCTVNKPLFLAPLPGIGNSNPREIYLYFLTNPNFIIAYTLCFLFVSLNPSKTLDTKRLRSFWHSDFDKSNLAQPSWWLHKGLLFSGRCSLVSGPTSAIEPPPKANEDEQGMPMCVN